MVPWKGFQVVLSLTLIHAWCLPITYPSSLEWRQIPLVSLKNKTIKFEDSPSAFHCIAIGNTLGGGVDSTSSTISDVMFIRDIIQIFWKLSRACETGSNSSQVSRLETTERNRLGFKLVVPEGFEPPTQRLWVARSYQTELRDNKKSLDPFNDHGVWTVKCGI